MSQYTYSPNSNGYRDKTTGRFVSKDAVLTAVQSSISTSTNKSSDIAKLLADGDLNARDAKEVIRQELKKGYIRQYMLGKGGGRDNMRSPDWGSVGGMLKEQYVYLDRFMSDVANSDLTEGQIRSRLNMYFNSSREAYERGNMASYGVPALPAYPGDGSTVCLTNCRCHWNIVREYNDRRRLTGWRCSWIITARESCDTCIARAVAWRSLFIPVGRVPTFEREEELYRSLLSRPHEELEIIRQSILESKGGVYAG